MQSKRVKTKWKIFSNFCVLLRIFWISWDIFNLFGLPFFLISKKVSRMQWGQSLFLKLHLKSYRPTISRDTIFRVPLFSNIFKISLEWRDEFQINFVCKSRGFRKMIFDFKKALASLCASRGNLQDYLTCSYYNAAIMTFLS